VPTNSVILHSRAESSEAVPRGIEEGDNMGTRDRAGVKAGCNACLDARPGRESHMEKGRQHIDESHALFGCRC
jgi:hypothetical protein